MKLIVFCLITVLLFLLCFFFFLAGLLVVANPYFAVKLYPDN
ncbi:hypothetical protein HMPREF9108_01516 [Leptotrichia sp. oral taxon 225 str. F0581]|nr:hypothetical protein HMPREF9108_01516 [Leptotrichia sp. oral taxon 225 str. F0581]